MQEEFITNDLLKSVYNSINYISIFFDNDIEIMLTDREEVLFYQGSREIDAKIKVGSPAGKFVIEAMEIGKNDIKIIPENFIGVAFKSYMIPIKDGQTVVGSIAIGKSLAKKNAVMDITNELKTKLSDIQKVITDITSGVNELAGMNSDILCETNAAKEKAKDTDNIVNLIKEISSQTNLLGLNAAIESARAGEYGRGFNIVAQEIRKLSSTSNESIGKIEHVIKSMSASVGKINNKVANAEEISNEQSKALREIASSIDQLNTTVKILGKTADEL